MSMNARWRMNQLLNDQKTIPIVIIEAKIIERFFSSYHNILSCSFQFMEVTRRGAAGVCVASHVTEELRLALVHAPAPRQHTEDETAGDWDQLQNQKDATQTSVQVSLLARHIYHLTYKEGLSDLNVCLVNNPVLKGIIMQHGELNRKVGYFCSSETPFYNTEVSR